MKLSADDEEKERIVFRGGVRFIVTPVPISILSFWRFEILSFAYFSDSAGFQIARFMLILLTSI